MHMLGHELWVPWERTGSALSKCPVRATCPPGPLQAAHLSEQQHWKGPKIVEATNAFQTTKPTGLISHTEGQETQFVFNIV